MDGKAVFEQVLILFLVMLVGLYARKRDIIGEGLSKSLSALILKITMPFTIIVSFHFDFSKEMAVNSAVLFGVALGIHFLSVLLGTVLYHKYPTQKRNVLKFITIFSNCAFMGFPVLDSIYGRIGIFYASIYVMTFNIFVWTYGIMLFSEDGQKDLKKAFLNPGILSVGIGLVIFLFSIQLPRPILQTLEMVGSLTSPLAMMIVGALLAEVSLKELFADFLIYYGTFIRLIVIPVISLLILNLFKLPEIIVNVSVILSAMPAAANTAIFAETYQADSLFASRIIAISTLFSLFMIPLIILFI